MTRMSLKVAVTESTKLIIGADEESLSLLVPLLSEPDVSSLSDALNLEVGGDVEIVFTSTEIRRIS